MGGYKEVSLKYYGIYLAYPPMVKLQAEGLGRYLAAFVKGASERQDIRFVIACPSWSKEMLDQLFNAEGINKQSVDIYSPASKYTFLSLYRKLFHYQGKNRKNKIVKKIQKISNFFANLEPKILTKLLVSTSISGLFFYSTLFVAYIIGKMFVSVWGFLYFIVKKGVKNLTQKMQLNKILNKLANYKKNSDLWNFYKFMEEKEIKLMSTMINQLQHVSAWYSPTAFWPSFNAISAPKLLCVPDVVLSEFPVGFGIASCDRVLENFHRVEKTIRDGEYFVTYSEHTKNNTLIKRYGIKPEHIKSIPHAINKLDNNIALQLDNLEQNTIAHCQNLLLSAFLKAKNRDYMDSFKNINVKFFFYASQFRPSKNILTLLRAYKFLLRQQLVDHKLILTGNPTILPEIEAFINEHSLSYDVLFLSSLSVSELAACYKLADLAINPTLSEGGFPFTFTEALSVGTPVIMSNIPVTSEVVKDEELQSMMLFDPYSWESLADKILWALENKKLLLDKQTILYKDLEKRTWTTVVNEYIEMLDYIALREKTRIEHQSIANVC